MYSRTCRFSVLLPTITLTIFRIERQFNAKRAANKITVAQTAKMLRAVSAWCFGMVGIKRAPSEKYVVLWKKDYRCTDRGRNDFFYWLPLFRLVPLNCSVLKVQRRDQRHRLRRSRLLIRRSAGLLVENDTVSYLMIGNKMHNAMIHRQCAFVPDQLPLFLEHICLQELDTILVTLK